MINYNKLMKKLEEKGITSYTIRQKSLIPQSTLGKFRMCSADNMEEIKNKLGSTRMNMTEKNSCVMSVQKL